MVRIEDVTVTWPEFQLRASLEAKKGQVLSILGPSGSGKTTTLRIIAGFEEPEHGRVWIGDREVTNLAPQRRRIGFVFQDYTLFPHMDVFENVGYGLHVQGFSRESRHARVARYLELVGLPGYENRRVETLSGGERQRVAVARALVVEPEVLLLDEPFSSMDAPLRKDLGTQLLRLQEALNITILFVTHSRSEALSISHTVAVMREGRILQMGSPEELYARPVDSFVAGFVGPANFFRGEVRRGSFESEELGTPVPVAPGERRDYREGEPFTLMLRPGSLSLCPEETEAFDASAGAQVAVTLRSRQFFGHYFEYECELPGGRRVTVFEKRTLEPGRKCRLLVTADAAVLLDS